MLLLENLVFSRKQTVVKFCQVTPCFWLVNRCNGLVASTKTIGVNPGSKVLCLLTTSRPLATRAGLHICYPAYYSNVESVHTNPLAGLTNYKDEVRGSRLRASYRARSGCIWVAMNWGDSCTSLLWFFKEIGTAGIISVDFIRFERRSLLDRLLRLVAFLVVETRKTLTRRNRFKSAGEAGKQQRIRQCMTVSQLYWEIVRISTV